MRGALRRRWQRLIGPHDESARIPTRIVLARFARSLRGRRRSRTHVRKTIRRVKWLCDTGEMPRLADLNATNTDKALRVLSGRNWAPKTINDYRAALFGMCQWAVKVEKLLSANPLESVAVQETAGDVRKVRRALTADEAKRLLAKPGPPGLWYETAMFTGLRVSELRALEWRDVDLSGRQPRIRLRAATTKARRDDVISLRCSLADKLRLAMSAFAKPTDRVFPTTPTRTTYCTWLSKSGTAPRVA